MSGFPALLFWLLGAVLLVSAAGCVSARNPVHAALCLILAFFTAAMLWLLLQAEFLGILLVLVYIGAVLLLFLFVVMMLGRDAEAPRPDAAFRRAALALALLLATELAAVLAASALDPAAPAPAPGNTAALGAVLYTGHTLAFELAAVALLIAIVAAVALTMDGAQRARRQRPARQLRARKRERLRLHSGRDQPPC